MIDFRLLGPLEAVRRRPVDLPGGKPRALLARLAARRERVVAGRGADRGLWESAAAERGEGAPGVRLAAPQGARRRGDRDARARVRRCGPVRLDLARFEELTELARRERRPGAGGPGSTARRSRSGAAPALAEFRREPFATAGGAAARRAAARRARAPDRGRARARASTSASSASWRRSSPQEPLREQLRAPADARALPLRPPGRGARVLPRGAAAARRRARDRAGPRAPGARAGDPPAGPRARRARGRPQRGAVVCVGAVPASLLAPLAPTAASSSLVELSPTRPELLGAALARARARALRRASGTDRVLHLRRPGRRPRAARGRAGRRAARRRARRRGAARQRSVRRRARARRASRSRPAARCSSRSAAAARSGRRSSSAPGSPARTACRCACSASRRRAAAATRAACSRAPRSPSSASRASPAEPVLVPPGPDGILAEHGLGDRRVAPAAASLDATRRALAERAHGAGAARPRRACGPAASRPTAR